jgi:hypothetical protein
MKRIPRHLRPASRQKHSLESIGSKQVAYLKAYSLNLFNISKSCIIAGIKRDEYYDWISKDKQFVNAINKIHEEKVDAVEAHYFNKYIDPNSPATTARTLQWWMERKVAQRGYGNKQEVEFKGDPGLSPVNITFVKVESPEQIKQIQEQKLIDEQKQGQEEVDS